MCLCSLSPRPRDLRTLAQEMAEGQIFLKTTRLRRAIKYSEEDPIKPRAPRERFMNLICL